MSSPPGRLLSPRERARRAASSRAARPVRARRDSSVRRREAAGVLLVALGLFLALSFVPDPGGRENLVGPLGSATQRVLVLLFAWGGLLVPVLAVVWGVVLFRGQGAKGAGRFSAVAGVAALACLTAVALFESRGWPGLGAAREGVGAAQGGEALGVSAGGMLAAELAQKLRGTFGLAGALILLALGVLLARVFATESRPPFAGARLSTAASALRRGGRALVWTLGVCAAAVAWAFSSLAGLLGVLGLAAGAARARLRPGGTTAAGVGSEDREAKSLHGGSLAGLETAGLPPPPGAPAAAAPRRERAAPRSPGVVAEGAVRSAGDADARLAPEWRAGGVWEVPLDLFDPPPPRDVAASDRELQERAAVLIRKLADFNVHGEVVRISSGPVITQFEVEPAPGVKVNQIANLADDLALAMRAQRIRIVAPIPGKGAVGIEIPNARPERVGIRELLASPAFREFRGILPIALGREISGAPVVADLARMPHLLIAGSTGSGKSVCINALLTSLLYRFSPAELRLVLIDPKMLELSMYNGVPHLLHPVVTRARDSATALKWAVYEMERRFELLAQNVARNITDFNARLTSGAELRGVDSNLGTADEPLRPLPYVVVVVDELADLMLTVPGEVEEPLARLAQKARAVGIHVVLATQRPSVNVLTGFIKANFPSRISFQVASKTDSRTVLDQNGAEALLGTGDMLFLPADRASPIRIQGAHVSGHETEALVTLLQELGKAREFREGGTIDLQKVEGVELDGAGADRDELFFEAARVVIEHDQGSTSLLQRRLKVGYSRAARIVDQLEGSGIVGPGEGSKPREVRIGLEELADMQAAAGRGTPPRPRSTSAS